MLSLFAIRRSNQWLLCGLLGAAVLAGSPASRADSRSFLPPAVGAFRLTHPAVLYTVATLETHIDGEGETMKKYGFKECGYGEYAPGGKGTRLITVDVYQMSDALGAYGYYSRQRVGTRGKFLPVGAEGYMEPDALNFWKGNSYVRIAIPVSNAPAQFRAALPQLARAVAARIPGSARAPAMLNLLPTGYMPHSETYQKVDIAAQSFLKNGVTARYMAAGPQAELFVASYPSAVAAKQAFGQYKAYITKPMNVAMGTKPMPVKGVGESAMALRSRFSGFVVAAVKGKCVIGVRKAKDQNAGVILARAAAARAK